VKVVTENGTVYRMGVSAGVEGDDVTEIGARPAAFSAAKVFEYVT
jgi:hypothetical protein